MTRRFAILAALAALFRPKAVLALPILYGDGKHDDTDALQAYINGENVFSLTHGPINRAGSVVIENCTFCISRTIDVSNCMPGPFLPFANCHFGGSADVLMRVDG